MKHDSIFRRLLSLLLVLTLVLPCFPIRSRTAEVEPDPTPEASAPATESEQQDTFFDRIKLYANGEETAAVELSTAEHLTLNAVFDLGEAAITTLTWQIYNPGDSQWVPIFGADSTQLQVGAALLSGMTDGQGRAILNCKITSGSALYYSHSIQIQLVEQADSPAPRSSRSARGGSLHLRLDDDEIIGGELHTHTVTVEYQKLDGTSVAQSYTATVKHGGSLTVNPHSPTVVGYTPYVIHVNGDPTQPFLTQDATFNGDAVKEAFASGGSVYYGVETQNLSINLTNITENYTYRVVYLPNKVTYTVSHYVQNISNDDYILYSVESLPGYVGEMTDATDLTADGQPLSQGFIPLKPFKNQEIAADGTTQINTYYDRQYFLITFKLDGGYGTEPVYARYGAPIHFEDPKRTGYEFKGWYRLQMERTTDPETGATTLQPRPHSTTDADGNPVYYPVYTNDKGQLLDEDGNLLGVGERFINLEKGTDIYYYVPNQPQGTHSGYRCEPIQTEMLPTTMQSVHAAMIAVWEVAPVEYTVIYWLENADHECDDPHTLDEHQLMNKDEGSDYTYWCSFTEKVQTYTNLKDLYARLENPHSTGTGASGITSYAQVLPSDVSALNGKSFVIYSTAQGKSILPEPHPLHSGGDGLAFGDFSPNQTGKATEWTFTQSGNRFYLSSNGQYIQASGNELHLVNNQTAATLFTVHLDRTNNCIELSYRYNNNNYYVQRYGNTNATSFGCYPDPQTYESNRFTLHELTTHDDPESNYYYYYYSDIRPLGSDGKAVTDENSFVDITVDANGTTILNVYFRRREYNLRFFYAREKDGQYQVVGGSTENFSKSTNDTTEGLLRSVTQWGNVTKPEIIHGAEYYAQETYYDAQYGYTYHYLVFTARYGQNIADEWPSNVMSTVTRTSGDYNTDPTDHQQWQSKTAIFSAWSGEYWLKYSRTRGQDTGNYTIKGNYQLLDEDLLYSPTYNNTPGRDPYYLRGTVIEYPDGPMTRYLDFIAFWENGTAGIDWNIPRQYHYYLWVLSEDQSEETKNAPATLRGDTLPNSQADFDALVRKGTQGQTTTKAVINGKVYELYDKVNSCDNAPKPKEQTIPGISGYIDVTPELGDIYYTTISDATNAGKTYYVNTETDPEIDAVYKNHYTLNFLFEPIEYTVTLQSWNHVKDLPNIPYGSMDAANTIKEEYTPEIMMNQYYPQDLPEGAYVFGGWYKTPEYLPGTEARLNTAMPNYNIILYAKWVPRKFDVQVYQTSDRDKLVYYQGTNGNLPMQSLAQYTEIKNLNYTGQVLYLPVETTDATMGKDYGTLLPEVVRPAGPDTTHGPLNSETGLYESATIPENMSPLDVENGLGDIRADWIFVCWAYMEDGVEHAIDVGSYQVHSNVQIYAKWTAKGIIDYRVDYVEADVEIVSETDSQGAVYDVIYARRPQLDANGSPVLNANGDPVFMVNLSPAPNTNPLLWPMTFNDSGMLCYAAEPTQQWFPMARSQDGNTLRVADSVSGKVNEGANRTFNAKTGNELFDLSSTGGKNYQVGYFPIHVSHTTLMQYGELCGCAGDLLVGQCETHPLVTTFYYIPLNNVNYTVYYLDGNGNPMADANGDGEIDRKDIDGKYVLNPADTGSPLQMVVTENYIYNADATPDALQKTLVLSANPEANKITFLYTHTPGSPYKVTHYVETLSDVCDYTDPDTLKHYNLYYTEDGHLLEDDGGNLPSLSVNLVSVPGYEYDRHISYIYDQWNDTDDLPSATGPHSPVKLHEKKKTGVALNQLQDALGNIAASITQDANGNISIKCSDQKHGSHLLKDNLYYYVQGTGENQVKYEVRDIKIDGENSYTVTYYEPKTGFSLDGPGKYGTEVDIFYDLKYYPYFVYHRVHGTDEILETIMGKALFQKQVTGSSWTETELINKGKPGYTVDSEDKTITMTMTMTIRDNNALQNINTMNFYYYEKSIQFKYVTMVLTNPGSDFRDWKAIVLDDPNARLSTTQQAVNASTGTPFTSQPIINNNAYRFLGWFYDEDCKEAVISDSTLMKYLSDGSNQKPNTQIEDFELEANRNTLAQYTVIQPQKFVGTYDYMDYAVDQDGTPKLDSAGNPYKEKKSADLTGEGVYVGEHNGVIHTNDRTFYALFLPMLGEITIKRENMGDNAGLAAEKYNQANSFVYQITGGPADKQISMEVTIDPGQSSVTVSNLPFGTYTVTQCNEWSWRYSDESQTVIISDVAPFADPIFKKEMASNHWLSGFSEVLENIFVEITTP